jgi:hypothetical protein
LSKSPLIPTHTLHTEGSRGWRFVNVSGWCAVIDTHSILEISWLPSYLCFLVHITSLMGINCWRPPRWAAQWRSAVSSLWINAFNCRIYRNCCFIRRVGFNVGPDYRLREEVGITDYRMPVAGAQYHWTADLAPVAPVFLSLMQGTKY